MKYRADKPQSLIVIDLPFLVDFAEAGGTIFSIQLDFTLACL
jgi:hypothetical protein